MRQLVTFGVNEWLLSPSFGSGLFGKLSIIVPDLLMSARKRTQPFPLEEIFRVRKRANLKIIGEVRRDIESALDAE